MDITLTHTEIEQAVVNHVRALGMTLPAEVEVTLTAGRGPQGYTATINLGSKSENVPVQEEAAEPGNSEASEEQQDAGDGSSPALFPNA